MQALVSVLPRGISHRAAYTIAVFISVSCVVAAFSPSIDLRTDANIASFGNDEKVDYFRLLEVDGSHLIVGAADNVFNMTIIRDGNTIRIVNSSHYFWAPTSETTKDCKQKALDQDDCHNFIRVLAMDKHTGHLLVCGTNAYKPLCRILDAKGDKKVRREFSGIGSAPLEPRHNTSFLLDGDYLYSATISDFTGADSLIFRRNINSDKNGIRTERNNLKQLNKPQFAGRIATNEHVYFFFRERTPKVESVDSFGTNGLYSRVARVCKNDAGGPEYFSNEWATFVKAQLNCSLPGAKQFFFDQIVSISNIIEVPTEIGIRRLVYATFVSDYDFLSHSVICAFDVDEIDRLFTKSDFLVSDSTKSAYYRKPREDSSLVGTCPEGTNNLTRDQMLTLKATPLMADLVPNMFKQAVGIYQGSDHYNQIAILPEVRLPEHDHRVDVLYVGTDQGNIIKFVSLRGTPRENQLADPLVKVSVMKVANAPIRRLLIFNNQYVVALTDRKVTAMPLAQCDKLTSCKACVEARDPHCGWHRHERKCVMHNSTAGLFLQDVLNGESSACKDFEAAAVLSAPVESPKSSMKLAPILSPIEKVNKTGPSQFKKHVSMPNCECADSPDLSNCPCATPGDIYASLRSSDPSNAESIEQAVTPGWHFPQWLLITILLVQLLIIIGLVVFFLWMKSKSKSAKSNVTSRPILAYDNGSPGISTRSTMGTLSSKTTTISPHPVPFTYGGSIPPETMNYEPFQHIHIDTQSEGYQSDSLGSKSGSDVASQMVGSSKPFRPTPRDMLNSVSRIDHH
uniref:Sema domain-containing protein n=1 Tax=Panagrellus redivivus TaxID=6233 RepID=A0A7E4V448_PANRE